MEPQTLLIGVAGFVLSFLAIYLISVFSMREKTFEEVLEEQRKRQEEEERKAKSDRKAEKGERKKYRKFKEKPKEKSSPSPPRETQTPAAESDAKAVVPAEVPVVEESVSVTAAAPTETSKAKSPKSSKKAQKSGDSNNLGDSSSGNPSGKNEKPLVATPVREETVEKNVQQVVAAAPEAESDKDSKTARKASPSKQSPPASASPAPQQTKKQKKQKQEQQIQPQEQQQLKNTKGTTNNVQAAPKSEVEEPKGNNAKTSKAAKQNANEALEKQILIVEQNQKPASEENTTKKLSKKEKKAAAAAAAAAAAVTTATTVTDTPEVVATEEKSVKDQAPKEKKSKKGKVENEAVAQLLSSVKGMSLDDSEIQTLLDHLQSRQSKKHQNDSVADIQKQLQEKEKKIIEVIECESKAQQAVTELKQKIISSEKQSENKLKKLMNENKTLQSEAKKIESDYEINLAALTDQLKQLESNSVAKDTYQKIVDEVNKLKSAPVAPVIDPAEMASMKQKVQIMEKELNNNVLKLNNSEKNRKKIEEKVKDFEAKAQNENTKLEELNLALNNFNNEKALLIEQNNQASEALVATQTECASLKSLLEDRESSNKEAERNLMNLSKKVQELEEELVIIKEKNQVLLEENKLVREKPIAVEENLGERQEPAGAPNGDVQQESVACTKVALVEHERLLGEKQSEIIQLTTELGNKETEINARLDEKDSEIKALTTSLNVQVEEVERLREEIQVFTNKNDELRKKNWKAMEAVESAEKSAVEKINSAVKTVRDQCQSVDKSVLKRIFPDITVGESMEHDLWIQTFEAEALEYMRGLKELPESSSVVEKDDKIAVELESRLKESEEKLSESEAKCNSLNEELQKLAAQTSATESVEDLNKQIETLTTQLEDSTLKYTKLESESEETQTKLEDRLKELELTFSETKTLCMSLKEQLENTSINNSTEESEKQIDTLTVQLEESSENVTKLEAQVQEYHNLLKVTDDKLQVLQKSVEDEEMKWRREQQTLQKSLLDAQKELEQLRQCQAEKNSTQSLEDVNSQTEKEDKYKLLVIRAEEDGKKVRDFSQTIVKLNGIIKTGQDALSQEQELVCKLKKQLADKNSTGSPSPTREMKELKKKLAQKEKEVEQVQLCNNSLTQKLAQLGVMASTSNDVGTSV